MFSLSLPVDSSHGPGDTNTQEDIDSVGAGNITNGVVGSIILDSGGLGSESIWERQILDISQVCESLFLNLWHVLIFGSDKNFLAKMYCHFPNDKETCRQHRWESEEKRV